MTDVGRQGVRRVLISVAVAAAVVGGCSGSSQTDPAATGSQAGSATSPSADPPSTGEVGGGSADLPAPEPGPLLQQALAAAAAGYHFSTTATVGETVALTAEGDRIGDGTRMAITSNGEIVDYIVTPDGTWAGQNDAWEEITSEAPVDDPLEALANPTSLVVTGYDETSATLAGTYPAAVFGLTGDHEIVVSLAIESGALDSLWYTTTDTDPPSSVVTIISALTDTTPITVPQA